MLYFLFVWLVLLIICGIIGTALLLLLQIHCFERTSDRWLISEWLGTTILAIAFLGFSLFIPLSPLLSAIVTLGLCSLLLWIKQVRNGLATFLQRLTKWQLLIGLGTAIAISAIVSRQVTWIDTGLYHYTVTQWLARFGTVPGIALLFNNFGFTSSWLAFAAPFNSESLNARVSAVTNGFVYFLATLQWLTSVFFVCRNKASLSDWFMLCFGCLVLPIVIGTNVFSPILVSLSPDIPIIFLIGVVAWTILIITVHNKQFGKQISILDATIIPLLLSIGAVAIKLTAIPLLITSGLFYIFSSNLTWRSILGRICLVGGVVFLLLLPFLVAGTITSGCPLYPSTRLCFDLPWLPATEDLQSIAKSTHGWTSWYGTPPADINPWIWFLWKWFESERTNQFTVFAIVLATLINIYPVILMIRKQSDYPLWLVAIVLIGLAFVMSTAPFIRYSFPYLVIALTLPIAFYSETYFRSRLTALSNWIASHIGMINLRWTVPTLFLFGAGLITASQINSANAERLILPPPMYRPTVVQKQVNDFSYLSPIEEDELCWATQIPCAFTVPTDVKLRVPERGIQAGFVRKR
jgi:hypothetical protein